MRLYKLIASGLGTGYFPIAPGTAGAVLGSILFYFINYYLNLHKVNSNYIVGIDFIVIVLTMLIGVLSIKKVHSIWEHDSSKIVIDEIVGVWIAAFAIPLNWKNYLYAFILFRFFDITKPFFIKKLDKKQNNWSVMLDDVLAGIYSLITLQILLYLNFA